MRKLKTGVSFPTISENVASYSPTSFCISLETITSRQLKEISKSEISQLPGKKILYHEIRHHIDHLSSLWGQKRILSLYEAVNSKFSMDEKEFYKMASYKILEKKLRYLDYYPEITGEANYHTPLDAWKWRITSGLRFDALGNLTKNPILFMRFWEPNNGLSLRTPISIASLLEVNAIYEETILEKNVIAQIPEGEHREKAKENFQKKMMRTIVYNQQMWEYNCALHMVSNILGISDVYEAYDVASSIATVVLNLDVNVLGKLKIDKEYMAVWGNRPENFVRELDLGFLLFNLTNNYKESYSKSKEFDLEEFLLSSNLPSEGKIINNTIASMRAIQASLNPKGYFNVFFSRQLESGLELLNMRGLDGKKQLLSDTFTSGKYIPSIVEKNATIGSGPDFYTLLNEGRINGNKMQDMNAMEWYIFSHEMYGRITEFYNVCGI
ncbi:hypothetical protein [Sphingobacterium detergens]|uniref:Uncharacterized protein n=1 Tax=Sphingobacterium detergens TaxID=1145106 RepID=A0A420ARU6_SPHD1|nr:hypothetical protein [Sphingobacterium detergens]RKE47113.1 hypothetical protein DFQ12_4274 [Sphingobacterium detergens]